MTDRFDLQKSAEQCMQQKIENYCKNTNAKDVEHAIIYQELKSSGFIRIVPPKEKPPMMVKYINVLIVVIQLKRTKYIVVNVERI